MENWTTYFWYLTQSNARNVILGSVLLTVTSSAVGCFTLLRHRALVGDAVAHSVLPGVCLAFILSGTKNPALIMAGAFISGWISVYLMEKITTHSKIKEDTATGLILSVFFGIGILLLTYIQHSGDADQTGLDSFIFGKAASLLISDLYVFGGTALLILLLIGLLFKELTLVAFDKNFARISGLPVKFIEFILTTLTVLAVVIGIQAVGVVLMAAMLITPAAAARFWTDNLKRMMGIAAMIGGICGIAGAIISYIFPSMPTGPWIVMIASFVAITSFMLAPRKGILSKLYRQRQALLKIRNENVLKVLFKLHEKIEPGASISLEKILMERKIERPALIKALQDLKRRLYVNYTSAGWSLTAAGKEYGARILRLHRMWELYLTKYVQLAPDHVHDDAEDIEHIITPEIEARLMEELNMSDENLVSPIQYSPTASNDHQ